MQVALHWLGTHLAVQGRVQGGQAAPPSPWQGYLTGMELTAQYCIETVTSHWATGCKAYLMLTAPGARLSAGVAQVCAGCLALAVHALSSTGAGAGGAGRPPMAGLGAQVATQLPPATLLAARQMLALVTRLCPPCAHICIFVFLRMTSALQN